MYANAGYPLHLLNETQTKLWISRPDARQAMATHLLRERYTKTGFGVLSADLEEIAVIDPRGVIRQCRQPFRRFHMSQAANAPDPTSECACRKFYDPEVKGAWGERDGRKGHHPFCQFSRTAVPVFNQASLSAHDRITEDKSAQERPDEWLRIRQEVENG